jgi:hypothetical protein
MVMISEEKLKNVSTSLKMFINLINKNSDFTKEKFTGWVNSLPKNEKEYLLNKLKGVPVNQSEVLKVLEEMITPNSTGSFQPTPKKNIPSEYKKGDVLMHPIFQHPYILLEKRPDGAWNCGLITSEEKCSEIIEACKSRFFSDGFFTKVLFTTQEPIGKFMYPFENGRQINSVLKKLKSIFK